MIETEENNPVVYIAGPMRGIQYYNFPAFDEAEKHLQSQCCVVISPAQLDRKAGFDPETLGPDFDWSDLMPDFELRHAIDRDIAAIKDCDTIYMLDGWRDSVGARAEKALAEWLGMHIVYQAPEVPIASEDILEEALRITKGDRQAQYGPPDQDFYRTAQLWSAIKGVDFEPREVAMFMIALKLSRETHQCKRDNWVDIAGYARCGSLC